MPIQIASQKTYKPPVQKTTPQQKETSLYQTLQGIWQGIRENRDTFLAPIVSQEDTSLAERTLYGCSGDGYADLLYRSISPRLRDIMDHGHFNPTEFLDPKKGVQQMDSKWPSDDYAVIYLMVSEGVQHGIKDLVQPRAQNNLAIYVGQAANGPNRCLTGGSSCHHWLLSHPDLRHGSCVKYKVARTGKRTVWIPFMLIKKSSSEVHGVGWEDIVHVAELTTVVLLKTWNPLVLMTANPQQMGSYARDYEAASAFRALIDKVSQKTGWSPAPTLGTNWTTPIYSMMPEERVWVSWYDIARQSYFFRTRCTTHYYSPDRTLKPKTTKKGTVTARGPGTSLCLNISGRKLTIPNAVNKAGHLEPGDGVHLICGNPEIEKLASMGLKFQWEDPSSGQWKECIGQRQRLFRNGEVSQLTTGMHIFSILTQRVYVSHNNTQPPDWMATGYRNTVKKIKYDHLKQTQTLETVVRRTVPWPKDNTVNENRMRLQAYLQGKGADTVLDDKKRMAKPRGPARENCDLCYSLMTTDPCGYDEETLSCWRCRAFNRPCTWTVKADGPGTTYASGAKKSTIDLLASGGPLDGLGIPALFHRAANMVKHPQAMVWTIEPPFAVGIESDVAEEQRDAPMPNMDDIEGSDDEE
ncbi:hypothetical protein KVR01_006880 [Diaporthe batatas]|uniref:uncharacterized protein n=1 Tax=Diaporthe batatas TaxID=748121 RepID=UPI001D04E724|nr:uncharacterized protein KVR01_006880 [Diaporthe batatas]KAG8163583.1 hypothetical protein KVR01_006880 [Diaporthe batatas]